MILTFILESAFPGAVGLQYRCEEGPTIVVILRDGKFVPPLGGWFTANKVYYVVYQEREPELESIPSTSTAAPEKKVICRVYM